MKNHQTLTAKHLTLLIGIICFAICVFMLYFRPQESWYDDAFWADWAYRMSQGGFVTHVWGGDQPSYSPLYALILALWYKIVGFSFFAAQLPNLIFALAAYLVICLRINNGQLISSKMSAICFALCYWFADSLFWIFSCGRVDTLCLLLGILTLDSFIRAYEKGSAKDIVWMSIWCFLEMATGFEGVVFSVILIAIYSLQNIRLSLQKWQLYMWYCISSCASFCSVVLWMTYHNCGKAFLRTIFGFSYTINSIVHFIETGNLSFENIVPLNDTMTIVERMNNMTVNGIMYNKEYLVGVSVVIVLSIIVLCRRKYGEYNITHKTIIISAIAIPWVYMLAGRYATYYTWAGYVPCCIAVYVLIQHSKAEKVLAPILTAAILIWFVVSPDHKNLKRIDFKREIDAQNQKDIEEAHIVNTESTYIPYQWYYYLAPTNDKLYFRGSGRYPKDMKKMILETEEVEDWSKSLELEYWYSIRDRKVYKVLGDYGKMILKDE